MVVLQYTPETLSRSLQAQAVTGDAGDRMDALRLKAAPVETIKLDAEIDADRPARDAPSRTRRRFGSGSHPELAALETAVFPRADAVQANISLASTGALEISPVEAPLTLFVWSENRIVPVRITDFSSHRGGVRPEPEPVAGQGLARTAGAHRERPAAWGTGAPAIYLAYHRSREQMAATVPGALTQLGIRRIP